MMPLYHFKLTARAKLHCGMVMKKYCRIESSDIHAAHAQISREQPLYVVTPCTVEEWNKQVEIPLYNNIGKRMYDALTKDKK